MKRCEQYEVELSAMLDGEGDPATAVGLLDHVCRCPSCRDFYQELRSFQSLVDGISPVTVERPADEAARAEAVREPRRRLLGWIGAVPRWAYGGAAAAVVVAVGLWAVGTGVVRHQPGLDLSGPSVTFELGEDKLSVDDQRFLELASEILGADRRYQEQMYVILDQVRQNQVPGESPLESESTDNEERGEFSPDAFAHIGGRRLLD
jgi:hypothetical protein